MFFENLIIFFKCIKDYLIVPNVASRTLSFDGKNSLFAIIETKGLSNSNENKSL